MKTNLKTTDLLSTLWIFIMLNMIFADIFGFMSPGLLKDIINEDTGVTGGLLLVAAVVNEIPIAMVVLSRLLKDRINRWANIIAGIITILYVIGGGSSTATYIFFAALEVACAALIIWLAWRWREPNAA